MSCPVHIYVLHCRDRCLRCGLSEMMYDVRLCLRGNVIVSSDKVNCSVCIYVEILVNFSDALFHISLMFLVV